MKKLLSKRFKLLGLSVPVWVVVIGATLVTGTALAAFLYSTQGTASMRTAKVGPVTYTELASSPNNPLSVPGMTCTLEMVDESKSFVLSGNNLYPDAACYYVLEATNQGDVPLYIGMPHSDGSVSEVEVRDGFCGTVIEPGQPIELNSLVMYVTNTATPDTVYDFPVYIEYTLEVPVCE